MLKKYKNALLDTISREGFDPEQFSVEENSDHRCKIAYQNSPLKFTAFNFTFSYHRFFCRFTPFAPDSREAKLPEGHTAFNIDELQGAFSEWLGTHLREYVDEQLEPDLWAQIEQQKSILGQSAPDENERLLFSEDEKVRLRLVLDQFRLLVARTLEPTQDETKIVEGHFAYLSEALDRLNRFDWKALLLSTTISISIALSLDTERGKQLFALLKQVFSGALHLLN